MYFCAAEGFGEPRSSLDGIRRGGFAHSRKTGSFKAFQPMELICLFFCPNKSKS